MLKFGYGNAKLSFQIATFSLPSGFTCPGAMACLSFANRQSGKITDGSACEFRCYSASQECAYPNVRASRWDNLLQLKGKSRKEMFALLCASLPPAFVYRVHVAGDFFSQDYFDAWMDVARKYPERKFYAYTKSLPFWVKRKRTIPANFILNASVGGKFDALILRHGLKCVRVVNSTQEAKRAGLAIDTDDTLAYEGTKDFALLIHGTQPAGSAASKAWQKVKGKHGGYSRA